MVPPVPPEEIAQLMQFIADKTENVKYPMSIIGLATQFKEETRTWITVNCLQKRILKHRHKIHKMKEFDMETKVKMIFALSTPIDDGFLNEMKKVADAEVDDNQRIVKYKQKDGRLELGGKHFGISRSEKEQRDRDIIQFLAEKSKTVNTPMADRYFLVEFKTIYGCLDFIGSLEQRYARLKKTIYQHPGIEKNTRIKMMFISNAKLSDEVLEELQKDAYLEVDYERRITKYHANDGSLDLERDHGRIAAIWKGRKRAREVSEDDYFGDPLKLKNDSAIDPYANNDDNGGYNYSNYHPSFYAEIMDHSPVEKKPEGLMEVKIEVPERPSTSNRIEHYYFDNDPSFYKGDLEHIPVEKKTENLIDVKAEIHEQSSSSNLEYHYEENMEQILIEPKSEIVE